MGNTESKFLTAAKENDLKKVRSILEGCKDPESLVDVHEPVTEPVKIPYQIKGTYPTKDGETALVYAAKNDNEEMIKLLLKYNASVSHADKDGNTALHWACSCQCGHHPNVQIARLLMEASPEVCNAVKANSGKTPFHEACGCSAYHQEDISSAATIVKMMLESGHVDVNTPSSDSTPLLFAIGSGRMSIVRAIFDACPSSGLDTTMKFQTGVASDDDPSMKRCLNVNLPSHYDHPLVAATYDQNFTLIVVELLNRGADPLATNNPTSGDTALHRAAGNGNLETLKALIDFTKGDPAVLNALNANQETAVHLACNRTKDAEPMIELLLSQPGIDRSRNTCTNDHYAELFTKKKVDEKTEDEVEEEEKNEGGRAPYPSWLLDIPVPDETRAILIQSQIDETSFGLLVEDDLKELGVALGPRKVLLEEIAKRKSE